jgi:general secretion pathway protein I
MRRRPGGFTLLEVMIALAILGSALVVLLQISAEDVRASYRAKLITIATSLARGKMYDLEEELYKNGFADSPEEEKGEFSDENQPKFRWEAKIEKVQLPQTDQVTTDIGKAGQQAAATAAQGTASETQQGGLASMANSTTGAMGAGMVQAYLPLIGPVLENAIRKVSLTVYWKVGSDEESLRVICFFTDTKAIMLMTGVQAAAASASSASGSSGSSGSGTKK